MLNTTKLIAAAALVTTTSMAHAGGLSPEIMEAPVVMEDEMAAPAASSISPIWIIAGIAGALLVVSMLEEEETTTIDDCEISCIDQIPG